MAWEHGDLSLGKVLNLQRLASTQATRGKRLAILDVYWGIIYRNIDRARRSGWPQTHAQTHYDGDFPLAEPSDGKDLPALAGDSEESGGFVPGNAFLSNRLPLHLDRTPTWRASRDRRKRAHWCSRWRGKYLVLW